MKFIELHEPNGRLIAISINSVIAISECNIAECNIKSYIKVFERENVIMVTESYATIVGMLRSINVDVAVDFIGHKMSVGN